MKLRIIQPMTFHTCITNKQLPYLRISLLSKTLATSEVLRVVLSVRSRQRTPFLRVLPTYTSPGNRRLMYLLKGSTQFIRFGSSLCPSKPWPLDKWFFRLNTGVRVRNIKIKFHFRTVIIISVKYCLRHELSKTRDTDYFIVT